MWYALWSNRDRTFLKGQFSCHSHTWTSSDTSRFMYSLVQWNWFPVVTQCTWVTCTQWRQRTTGCKALKKPSRKKVIREFVFFQHLFYCTKFCRWELCLLWVYIQASEIDLCFLFCFIFFLFFNFLLIYLFFFLYFCILEFLVCVYGLRPLRLCVVSKVVCLLFTYSCSLLSRSFI